MATGIHERLGVVLLNEILSDGDALETKTFCKVLLLLNVTPSDAKDTEALNTLRVLTLNAGEVVDNRFAKTFLTKFQNKLAEIASGEGEFSSEQQEAVLSRTKSHIARRQEEISAALCNEEGRVMRTLSRRSRSKPKVSNSSVHCWPLPRQLSALP
jgi:hypothetical protein